MGMSVLGAEAAKAGINFVTQVGSNAVGGLFGINQAKKNRAFQERMYNKQVQDTIDFWKMQQDYNLPSAQLQRIQDAGLSGLLMYGEGGLTGNIAGQAPSLPSAPHGAQAATPSFNTRLDLENIALLDQQMAESKSREYLNYKEAENREADTGLKGLQGEQLKIETDFNKDSYELRLDILKSEKDLKDSMFYLNYRQANVLQKQIDVMQKTIENFDSEIESRKNLTDAQVKKFAAEVEQGWRRLTGELKLMNAQARNALANAFAATVNANIAKGLYSDSYIKILQGAAGQEFVNAIRSGDAQVLQNGILAKQFGMTPGFDTSAGQIAFWCKNVVSPITDIAADAAMTAGGVGIAAKSMSTLKAPTAVKGFGK